MSNSSKTDHCIDREIDNSIWALIPLLGVPGETDNLCVLDPFTQVGGIRSWIRQKGMLLLFDKSLEPYANS